MPAKADSVSQEDQDNTAPAPTLGEQHAAAAAKKAEQDGGETAPAPKPEVPKPTEPAANTCPDCNGEGIRNPSVDHQVCPTCEGRGTIV